MSDDKLSLPNSSVTLNINMKKESYRELKGMLKQDLIFDVVALEEALCTKEVKIRELWEKIRQLKKDAKEAEQEADKQLMRAQATLRRAASQRDSLIGYVEAGRADKNIEHDASGRPHETFLDEYLRWAGKSERGVL